MRFACHQAFWIPLQAAWLALTGCASSEEEAAAASAEYEVAIAAGDAISARNAMLRAVQAQDDVASYWMALARAQVSLRQYADAYYAYVRAVELDRTNVEALQSLSELALASGRLNEAEQYAGQVELLQPGSLGAVTTRGYIALRQRNFDEAVNRANTVLASIPQDATAKILKARALQGQGAQQEGAALLEEHLAARGDDVDVLRALLALYRQHDDVSGVLRTGAKLVAKDPADLALHFEHARDLYRAGFAARARPVALSLAARSDASRHLADILSLWLSHEERGTSLSDARRLVESASPGARILYARFFIEAGQPAEAEALLHGQAALPVTSANADALAVLGRARTMNGKPGEGLELLNSVLRYDATNLLALRGRADHYLASGRFKEATSDALRVVAESPSSPQDRLRLAECYRRMGNLNLAEKVYWDAFWDIPANPRLHASLRSFLKQAGRPEAVVIVDTQYEDQKRRLRSKLVFA
jgi:tetratricopeptide (TPR) repeat protein